MRVSANVLAILDRAECDGNALSLTALGWTIVQGIEHGTEVRS